MTEFEQLPVREARAGDPAAWNALFKRYQLPLYTYVFELIHHEQASLDIVQESFINAARHIRTLRQDDKFGSWLFGIAHQKCAQHWRRQRPDNMPLDEQDEFPDAAGDPAEILISKEQEAGFMKILDQLSPPHRAVVLLHFVEEFSIGEIAAITGARPGTVKSRLHYAKNALRQLLTGKSK
ncbi:MAG: RNA polymerase sigma factor [Verrucomicrobiota bacterium]